MKKTFGWMIALPALLFVAGCATTCDKNQVDSLESRISSLERKVGSAGTQETMSNEIGSTSKSTVAEVVAPETPSKEDIQAALKNAGYYEGTVDGKFGPRTQKAIEDFQAANELKADGKVGPNTWSKLKKFYVSTATSQV
jgi:peptidoglycan hydrolase-like protein with peptidoglycan-binding domain